jgi:hypothetical protein
LWIISSSASSSGIGHHFYFERFFDPNPLIEAAPVPRTISDDPSEDANNLDDDALFEAYLDAGNAPIAGIPATDAGDGMPDWPPVTMRNVGLSIDTATLAWFKSNHTDWRAEVGFVLRAWVAAQADAGRNEPITE